MGGERVLTRRYFKKSIAELEAIYERDQEDREALELLLGELEFRSTQRAEKLKTKARTAINNLKPTAPSRPVLRPKADQKGKSPASSSASTTIDTSEESEPSAEPPKVGPKPAITNDPDGILRAWTALEVLSPQSFRRETDLVAGDRSRIARFDDKELPWLKGERSRPKKRLYYELILGSIALGPAVERLLKIYSD